jgi:hypothetical protein
MWAPLGLGIGALLRNQVTTLVAIFVWLFFIEHLLIHFVPDAGQVRVGRRSRRDERTSTQRRSSRPPGALLLAPFSAVSVALGALATLRGDRRGVGRGARRCRLRPSPANPREIINREDCAGVWMSFMMGFWIVVLGVRNLDRREHEHCTDRDRCCHDWQRAQRRRGERTGSLELA